MTPETAAAALVNATVEMHDAGIPLMRRILPDTADITLWDHYPPNDQVSKKTGARFFYHCHPPEERGANEHGHFHLFLSKSAMVDPDAFALQPVNNEIVRVDVVHIAALSISADGLPTALFTVNRWVTDEWLFPHTAIAQALPKFDLSDAGGDALVNIWLTALVHVSAPTILGLLEARDIALARANWAGEDRALEILSHTPIDIQSLVAPYL